MGRTYYEGCPELEQMGYLMDAYKLALIVEEMENNSNYRLREEKAELLEMVKEMYSAITNGHTMKFTHDDYRKAIQNAEEESE